ncbi:hypothetical protein TWF506_005916 [Arthrobotrys conoides]|uniref:Extracellular membrane protein CFEM domain-containing protein n=1 Tax=Arthrobotrys conoides TaxID=74498 RepID=A0AAN8NKL0_9PEZI
MRVSIFAIASILAVAVSAQDDGIPESCTNVVLLSQQCIPEDANAEDLQTNVEISRCLCAPDANFDNQILDCLGKTRTILPEENVQFLEGFQNYCSLIGGGGGGGGSIPTTSASVTRPSDTGSVTVPPTSTPTGGDDNVPENCRYIAAELSSCWTDDSPLPTAAPVARCLCSATSFDAAVEGCYSDIRGIDAEEASTVSSFLDFCSKFSGGSGGAGPTSTDDNNQPTSTGGSNSPEPTNTGSNGNNGGNGPNSAAGFKATILGTALAAILAGAALIL